MSVGCRCSALPGICNGLKPPSAVAIRRKGDTLPNPMPSRVLILFAHPMSPRSLRANRAPAEAVRGMDGVTFHDLG